MRSADKGCVTEAMVFTIMAQDHVIGHSELEYGDPPMGVASGRFVPAASFEAFTQSVEPNIKEGSEISIWNELSIVSVGGVVLECLGVAVFRYDFGEGVDYQVDVMGIGSPPYKDLFPHHVAAYAKRFPPSDT